MPTHSLSTRPTHYTHVRSPQVDYKNTQAGSHPLVPSPTRHTTRPLSTLHACPPPPPPPPPQLGGKRAHARLYNHHAHCTLHMARWPWLGYKRSQAQACFHLPKHYTRLHNTLHARSTRSTRCVYTHLTQPFMSTPEASLSHYLSAGIVQGPRWVAYVGSPTLEDAYPVTRAVEALGGGSGAAPCVPFG